ncbi:hypothetical protein K443DRAFT_124680 [Laccaria amethystina LaAM-08-1]|uniref:Uncharacterized protein n=1 Tax=Laccaria amethystina LaAM-08-1 TaxID=1095629 RepID=A0A0C9XI90_9AGAR|nr:hypothetical protein K443DRAFT_124680 [Laccaria amethystina LaAM-08-1]
MVHFSFLSESSPGCVASSGSSTWWTNASPPDLVTAIKEAHSKGENILSVSVANDGDWFLSTDSVNRKKPGNDPMTSRVLRFCHVATMKTGRETGLGNIAWITFTPDGQGFIGVVGHDGVAHCVFEKLPKTLDDHLKTHNKQSQMKMVSIGHKNSWAIVYEDGDMSVEGISTSLVDKLKNVRSVGFNVESIILSPSTISNFVVTYENGASHYDVPYAWKSGIDNQISLCQQNYQQIKAMNNAAMLRLSRAAMESAAMVANAQASAAYYQSFGNF